MSGMVRRSLQVRRRMQHAVNGIVTDLTVDEAAGSVDLNVALMKQQFKLPQRESAR